MLFQALKFVEICYSSHRKHTHPLTETVPQGLGKTPELFLVVICFHCWSCFFPFLCFSTNITH